MKFLRSYAHIGPEISGSLGDLGVFLPYVIGAITIGGMNASGVFVSFGLAYLFIAYFYRIPVPVQPMKIVGALVIVAQISPGEAVAASLMLALTLTFFALSGLIDKCAQFIPNSIIAGVQVALGLSLGRLSIEYITNELWLGLTVALLMLFFLHNRVIPVALLGLAVGALLSFLTHSEQGSPHLVLGFYLPELVIPTWADFRHGFTLAFLPQLPLTLTNGVLITSALAAELYPKSSQKVSPRNLCLTTGVGNLALASLSGLPFGHGSSGLAAHYSFGGRTALTPAIIGILLLFLGLFLGPHSVLLLALVPPAVIGSLLLFSSLELVTNASFPTQRNEVFCFAVVVISGVAINIGVAVVIGLVLTYLFHKNWISI